MKNPDSRLVATTTGAWWLRVGTGLLAVALILGAYVAGDSNAPLAPRVTPSDPSGPFYLVIGGSSSRGTQPSGITDHNFRLTTDGYANDLVALEAKNGIDFQLHQIGCQGETLQSILSVSTPDHCYALPTTQLTKAESFLRAHQHESGLVTIDIGFNDIRPCLTHTTVNETCVAEGVNTVHDDLATLVRDLRAAAGPSVYFVGFEYYDPFLGHFLDGADGPVDAQATLVSMNEMNATLGSLYASLHVPVANEPTFFDSADATDTFLDNVGEIPTNVMKICSYTWMCQSAPFGPDDHPDNAGYMVVAESIVAALPPIWRISGADE